MKSLITILTTAILLSSCNNVGKREAKALKQEENAAKLIINEQ